MPYAEAGAGKEGILLEEWKIRKIKKDWTAAHERQLSNPFCFYTI